MAAGLDPALARHDLDGVARFVVGPGGLPVLEIRTEQCTAQVFVHGAHVARWAPAGQADVLWLSPKSAYAPGKAIRGGVPLSFPWFAARDPRLGEVPAEPRSPNHGFVRTKAWRVDDVRLEDNGRVRVTMSTRDDADTRALWDHAFECTMIATLGQTLTVALEVKNTGDREFAFEEALHTYFAVGDVERTRVVGLERVRVLDKVAGVERTHDGADVTFGGQVDAVYVDARGAVVVDDPVLARHIRVEKTGSRSTVVWNPGLVVGQTMPDVGGEAWRSFVCVEAANALPHPVTLPPGAVHAITQRLTVIPQQPMR